MGDILSTVIAAVLECLLQYGGRLTARAVLPA